MEAWPLSECTGGRWTGWGREGHNFALVDRAKQASVGKQQAQQHPGNANKNKQTH